MSGAIVTVVMGGDDSGPCSRSQPRATLAVKINNLQQFVLSQPEGLKWFAIALISAIPFVEVYFGTAIGVVAGLPPILAASAAITGNAIAVLAVIMVSRTIRDRARRPETRLVTPRRERTARLFARFGVPGVSLLVHPTQISAAALIGFGAQWRTVALWQLISIVAWGSLVSTVVSIGGVLITR